MQNRIYAERKMVKNRRTERGEEGKKKPKQSKTGRDNFKENQQPLLEEPKEAKARNTPKGEPASHPRPPPPALTPARLRRHRPVIRRLHAIRARHQRLPRPLRLRLDILPQDDMALPVHEGDQRNANDQGQRQENDVDGDGVVAKGPVRQGVEAGLREVEEARQADDQAVDFAEGGEAEDFGGVVAVERC